MAKARISYKRIVLYQRRSAWVEDIGSTDMLAASYSTSEEYFRTGAGTSVPIARNRVFEVPIIDQDVLHNLEVMRKEGCEIRMIAIGENFHVIWNQDSAIDLVPFAGGPGQFGGQRLRLESGLFEAAVYQHENVLFSVPWTCETAESIGGVDTLPGPAGYPGDRWTTSVAGVVVDESGILASGNATLVQHFPLEGATISLEDDWIGTVKTLDWTGATLTTISKPTSATVTAVVDDGTWKIETNLTLNGDPPVIRISLPGDIAAVRPGECIDCTDLEAEAAAAPDWSS